tara:strand:+ start:292 stop:1071 length:780 start_codon:yes stop_codon:yes gene_type:complete
LTGNGRSEKKSISSFAGVAQLVEHHLAKVDVEGSNPFARSIFPLKASELFVFPETLPFAKDFLPDSTPWEWVSRIEGALQEFAFIGGKLASEIPNGFEVGPMVFMHPTVKLPSHGCILGPAYIGENCEIRPGAFLRKNIIVGKNCVLGNACEYKNSLLLNDVQTPHFNYVGDSVLGNRAHLGAGTVLANLRFDQGEVQVSTDKGKEESGLRKLGGLLGDDTEIGCNTTLMPGTILERKTKVGPALSFSGRLESGKNYLR